MKLGIVIAYYQELQTIDAVLDAFKHIEVPFNVYLIEDCSPKSVQPILDKWGDKPWFNHLANEVNQGCAFGFNRGVQAALADGCEFIAINDSDDIAYPNKFKLQLEMLENDPELMLVGGAADMVDQDTDELLWRCYHPTESNQIHRQHRLNSTFIHSTVVYRADLFEKVGFYKQDSYMPDYELLSRILHQGFKVANVPEIVIRYNIRQDSQSVSRPARLIRSRIATQIRYFEPLNIWCYLGLMRSGFAYMLPGKTSTRLKTWVHKVNPWTSSEKTQTA